MKRIILFLVLIFLSITLVSGSGIPTAQPGQRDEIEEVELVIQEAITSRRETALALIISEIQVENVAVSQDGEWGVGWLIPADPQTGEFAPIEPGLAITVKEKEEWQVLLPNDVGWIDALQDTPDDVLSQEIKDAWIKVNTPLAVAVPTEALHGYLLPWEAGVTRNLTQSTCHDEYTSSGNAHYAFDFSTYGVLWNIYASKAAKVWLWKDDVPTCYAPTCSDTQALGNYIVLRDETTNPITYQLYLHLAQDSIPDNLKVQGKSVSQGQFIGIVDNTGQSWGHHLHYQVQVPLYGDNYYWGRSVDITFEDVDINGGRPRVINSFCNDLQYCDWEEDVCDEFRGPYTSQNEITIIHENFFPLILR
jgi:hypothetical protein